MQVDATERSAASTDTYNQGWSSDFESVGVLEVGHEHGDPPPSSPVPVSTCQIKMNATHLNNFYYCSCNHCFSLPSNNY